MADIVPDSKGTSAPEPSVALPPFLSNGANGTAAPTAKYDSNGHLSDLLSLWEGRANVYHNLPELEAAAFRSAPNESHGVTKKSAVDSSGKVSPANGSPAISHPNRSSAPVATNAPSSASALPPLAPNGEPKKFGSVKLMASKLSAGASVEPMRRSPSPIQPSSVTTDAIAVSTASTSTVASAPQPVSLPIPVPAPAVEGEREYMTPPDSSLVPLAIRAQCRCASLMYVWNSSRVRPEELYMEDEASGSGADAKGVNEVVDEHFEWRVRVEEILETERSYVAGLRVAVSHFIRPISEAAAATRGIVTTPQSLQNTTPKATDANGNDVTSPETAMVGSKSGDVASHHQPQRPSGLVRSSTAPNLGKSSPPPPSSAQPPTAVGGAGTAGGPKLVTPCPPAVQSIFTEYQGICGLNGAFLSSLEDVLHGPATLWHTHVMIGRLFAEQAQMFHFYGSFVKNYDAALAQLRQWVKGDEGLAAFVHQASRAAEAKRRSLEDFLIMPVQRVPRYVLLLKELLRYTPATSADHGYLRAALATVEAIAARLNERTSDTQRRARVVELQGRLDGIPEDFTLVAPHRSFIHEGEVQWLDSTLRGTPHTMLLFSDLVVLAVAPRFRRGDRLQYITKIELQSARVEDLADKGKLTNAFQISETGPVQRSLMFTCSSQEDKLTWVQRCLRTLTQIEETKRTRNVLSVYGLAPIPKAGSGVSADKKIHIVWDNLQKDMEWLEGAVADSGESTGDTTNGPSPSNVPRVPIPTTEAPFVASGYVLPASDAVWNQATMEWCAPPALGMYTPPLTKKEVLARKYVAAKFGKFIAHRCLITMEKPSWVLRKARNGKWVKSIMLLSPDKEMIRLLDERTSHVEAVMEAILANPHSMKYLGKEWDTIAVSAIINVAAGKDDITDAAVSGESASVQATAPAAQGVSWSAAMTEPSRGSRDGDNGARRVIQGEVDVFSPLSPLDDSSSDSVSITASSTGSAGVASPIGTPTSGAGSAPLPTPAARSTPTSPLAMGHSSSAPNTVTKTPTSSSPSSPPTAEQRPRRFTDRFKSDKSDKTDKSKNSPVAVTPEPAATPTAPPQPPPARQYKLTLVMSDEYTAFTIAMNARDLFVSWLDGLRYLCGSPPLSPELRNEITAVADNFVLHRRQRALNWNEQFPTLETEGSLMRTTTSVTTTSRPVNSQHTQPPHQQQQQLHPRSYSLQGTAMTTHVHTAVNAPPPPPIVSTTNHINAADDSEADIYGRVNWTALKWSETQNANATQRN